jgi:hypothetical protein
VRFHSSGCTCCRAQSALDLIKQPELQRRARKERGLSASGPRFGLNKYLYKMTDPNHPLDAHRRLPLISRAMGVSDKGAYCLRFGLKSWINDLRIEKFIFSIHLFDFQHVTQAVNKFQFIMPDYATI